MLKSSNKQAVCIAKCLQYDKEAIKRILLEHIDSLGGIDALLSKGKRVAVKPNLVMRKSPEAAATTNPVFFEAVCEIFVEAGCEVTVAESSGGLYNQAVMNMTYKTCGIADAAKNAGARLHTDFGDTVVSRDENELCRSFNVINPIVNADLIVNVCKLKTHTIATMSGAVKNMFGIIPGLAKVELHSRFPEISDFCKMIVELNKTVPCGLSIMDAIDAMEGNGPTAGTKTKVGAVLSSLSPYALDIAAAALAKIPFERIPTLEAARDVLEPSPDSIEIIGESIESLAKELKLPDTVDTRFQTVSTIFGGRLKKYLEPKPKISTKRCKVCGDCVRNCPQKLIFIKKGKVHIKHDGCIHCFCCHELCREHAIDIKKPFIIKL